MQKTSLKTIFALMGQKRITTVAGAWVYYFLVSLIPLAVLVVSAFSVFNVSLLQDLAMRLPQELRSTGQAIVQTAENASRGATLFFVGTIIFSCSGLLNQMSKDGDFIYGLRSKVKRGIVRRLWAILALGVLFLLLVGLAFLFAFSSSLKIRPFAFQKTSDVISFLTIVVAIFFGYVIIYLLNKFICPVKVKFSELALGSLIAFVIMVLGTFAFTIYLRFFANYNVFYGSLAGVIVFLIWAYILMFGLSFGVVINMCVYSRKKQIKSELKNGEKVNYATNKRVKKELSKGHAGS